MTPPNHLVEPSLPKSREEERANKFILKVVNLTTHLYGCNPSPTSHNMASSSTNLDKSILLFNQNTLIKSETYLIIKSTVKLITLQILEHYIGNTPFPQFVFGQSIYEVISVALQCVETQRN